MILLATLAAALSIAASVAYLDDGYGGFAVVWAFSAGFWACRVVHLWAYDLHPERRNGR